MKIGGVSIILILGLINMILILFQPQHGTSLDQSAVPNAPDDRMTLFISAALHGLLAYLAD